MPTLQQALGVFLLIERSSNTQNQYRLVLGVFVRAIGPERDIRLIRFEDLLDYQARLRQGHKPSTVTSYTAILKTFFSWCLKRNYIEVNPAADLARIRQRIDPTYSRAIPPDELRRMVEYTRVTSPRNYALMLFLCDTGCRVSGLTSLTIQRLDFTDNSAVLEEKGGVYHRVVFGDETASAVKFWLTKRPEVSHDCVWTGRGPHYPPMQRQSVERLLRDLSHKIGASRIWSPHAIRHAVGHAWAKAGMPPHVTQQKLGHAHITTTLTYYYPRRDPYVEVASRELSLATLRDDDELHELNLVDVVPQKKRKVT